MKAIPIFLYKVVNAFVSGLQSKSVMVATTFFEMVSRGRCWNKTVSNDSLVILPFCSIVFFLLSCVYMKTKQAKSNHFLFLNSKHGVVILQKIPSSRTFWKAWSLEAQSKYYAKGVVEVTEICNLTFCLHLIIGMNDLAGVLVQVLSCNIVSRKRIPMHWYTFNFKILGCFWFFNP